MKSGKGITLISLVVYVASFLVIASIVALISNFFFSNSKVLSSQATASTEFDMLNLYLVKEAKQSGNIVIDVKEDKDSTDGIEKKIVFNNGNEYIFIKEVNEEYGKIIFSCPDKFFVLSNYIEDLELPKLDIVEEFEITVKILGKEYKQNYIIEK